MRILVIPILIVAAVWAVWFAPHDDTDAPGDRSGLSLYIDHKTGCQYIRAGGLFGSAVTPRIDAQGRPMCNAPSADSATERKL